MSLEPAQINPTLRRILAEESQLLVQLEALLEQESTALAAEDLEAIGRVGAHRHACVGTLARLEAERSDFCRMLGFGRGRQAVERLCDWCDPTGTLRAGWAANLAAAGRCKQLNDRNGAVVAARLSAVQRRLAQLRGTASPPVYSARGTRPHVLGARDLGRA